MKDSVTTNQSYWLGENWFQSLDSIFNSARKKNHQGVYMLIFKDNMHLQRFVMEDFCKVCQQRFVWKLGHGAEFTAMHWRCSYNDIINIAP